MESIALLGYRAIVILTSWLAFLLMSELMTCIPENAVEHSTEYFSSPSKVSIRLIAPRIVPVNTQSFARRPVHDFKHVVATGYMNPRSRSLQTEDHLNHRIRAVLILTPVICT